MNKIFMLAIVVLSVSCRQNEFPKPHSYFRISFPEKEYTNYAGDCPFTFEYPVYGKITPVANHTDEPCLFNLSFPAYKGTLHLTYKAIDKNLDLLLEDDWTFVFKKIAQKADAIDIHSIANPDGKVYATIYDIKGNAASPVMFYATDSTRHYLRGSFYFSTPPNYDSLTPAIQFFRKDVVHLVEKLNWKN
ncbi:MAG: gliding motility lipoprotein GldD [Bacteroidales bacterium]|jgi:gliding motility-associated lipoprotein GldD|nr:gliding motility lipoprotein GldD [Bacteroidales bacterium]